ncbi:hypothetical protein WJX74_002338 [Apatococcus lobatus]|uniref:Ribosome assembly factor mrt4 n=2 Tax=Apatococcus TaxID=904362 RepID=A0AAW1SQW8_9CHLO
MPKSKRNREVTLSKVKKKPRTWKEGLITQVRELVDRYPSAYVFQHSNMRNDKFKELREKHLDTSRFCMGSTKLLQVGLGRSQVDEYQDNLSQLSATLTGAVGLFFTSLPHAEVSSIFESFQEEDFARAGMKATEDVDLQEGPLEGPSGPLPHTLEPSLRKHGLPTKLDRSVVTLLQNHRVCSTGERLSPDQAHLLRVFGIKMAVFRMRLLSHWLKDGGVFEELAEQEDAESDEGLDVDGMPGELPASMLLPPGVLV